ncbi:MAG: two-component system sensor histidine kinase/response regulator, partial [Actinomycetia bacterium]|nr:two-component system sensor histidine kinase/response regulator [Actinomycetes bacterium]
MAFSLLQNIALLVALATMQQFIVRRWRPGTLPHRLLSGLLFGGTTVLGMLTRVEVVPGVFYDGRSIILAVAGMFGGPVAATIAAAIAAAYRLYLGGAGTIAGVGVIVEATVAGIAMYYLRRRHEEVTRSGWLYLFAVLVHVGMLLIQFSLPGGMAPGVLRQIAAPVLVMYPLGQLLVCRLILDQEERLTREKELERLTASLG